MEFGDLFEFQRKGQSNVVADNEEWVWPEIGDYNYQQWGTVGNYYNGIGQCNERPRLITVPPGPCNGRRVLPDAPGEYDGPAPNPATPRSNRAGLRPNPAAPRSNRAGLHPNPTTYRLLFSSGSDTEDEADNGAEVSRRQAANRGRVSPPDRRQQAPGVLGPRRRSQIPAWERLWACDQCDKAYTTRQGLQRQKNEKHS